MPGTIGDAARDKPTDGDKHRGIVVVGSEHRTEPVADRILRRERARVTAATHDVRRAEHDLLAIGHRIARHRLNQWTLAHRYREPPHPGLLVEAVEIVREHHHAVPFGVRRQPAHH